MPLGASAAVVKNKTDPRKDKALALKSLMEHAQIHSQKMGLTKIGQCLDAFDIKGRGTILAFHLYAPKNKLKHGQKTKVSLCKNGNELGEFEAEYAVILSGKKHRYDMDLFNLVICKNGKKTEAINSTVYVHDDIDFWIPEDNLNEMRTSQSTQCH